MKGIKMFNGTIFFQKTKHGYRIDSAYKQYFGVNCIVKSYSFLQLVMIEGSFNFKPVRGQFCKRPHLLLNWNKS